MLKIDSNLIWTIVNLLILYVLMRKFLFKPVQNILAKRNAEIEESFANAEKKNQEVLAAQAKVDEQLQEMDKMRADTVRDAKTKAKEEYDKIIAAANEQSDEIIKKAKDQSVKIAHEEKKKAQAEMVDVVKSAATKMANKDSDAEIYDDFLSKLK